MVAARNDCQAMDHSQPYKRRKPGWTLAIIANSNIYKTAWEAFSLLTFKRHLVCSFPASL